MKALVSQTIDVTQLLPSLECFSLISEDTVLIESNWHPPTLAFFRQDITRIICQCLQAE